MSGKPNAAEAVHENSNVAGHGAHEPVCSPLPEIPGTTFDPATTGKVPLHTVAATLPSGAFHATVADTVPVPAEKNRKCRMVNAKFDPAGNSMEKTCELTGAGAKDPVFAVTNDAAVAFFWQYDDERRSRASKSLHASPAPQRNAPKYAASALSAPTCAASADNASALNSGSSNGRSYGGTHGENVKSEIKHSGKNPYMPAK
jgi:hypothetical protein